MKKPEPKKKKVIERTTTKEVPYTYVIAAEVGLTCRMIDVKTGEVILVASDSYEGVNNQVAAEYLVMSVVKRIKKVIKSRTNDLTVK